MNPRLQKILRDAKETAAEGRSAVDQMVERAEIEVETIGRPETPEEWAQLYNAVLVIATHGKDPVLKEMIPTLLSDFFREAMASVRNAKADPVE